MERRILISGIVLTISIVVFIGLFFIHSNSKDTANPIRSVPQDAAIILKLNGPSLLHDLHKGTSKVWQDLSAFPSINTINTQIGIYDSLLKLAPKLADLMQHRDVFISGHSSGGKKIDFITLIALGEGIGSKDFTRILGQFTQYTQSKRKYEGKFIYSVKLGKTKSLHLSFTNGLLLYSTSPVLIEDAIRQSSLTTSLLDNTNFMRVFEATGKNKEANLFMDLSQLGKLYSQHAPNHIAKQSREFKDFGGWSELDINLKNNLILANGFSYNKGDGKSLLEIICQGKPVKITTEEILPASTIGYISFGMDNPVEYYENYKKYLKKTDKFATYDANLKDMNAKYGVEFEKVFLSIIDNQITIAQKHNASSNTNSEFLIFKCKSGSTAKVAIESLIETLKPKLGGTLEYKYSPDNELTFPIYRIPIYPMFGRLLGNFFNVIDENYLAIVDNYLVVGGSYKDVSELLYDFMLKRTLPRNEQYRQYSANLSAKSCLQIYANLSKSPSLFKRYLHPGTLQVLEENPEAFENNQIGGLQISEVSNLPYFNVFINHLEDYRGRPQTVWESLLDSSISQKPKFVLNHYTKQNEIIVQDDKNNLYLLNQAGRILWKVALQEKIISEIHQIDFYKNTKLQFIFNTKSRLHLIDRNGNYVERYPVNLRSPATAGMALFDYESNKNYRILIPGTDKKVYAYSKEGDIINGWKFRGAGHTIKHTPKHFKVGAKDFIIFGDKNTTYILDRKGNDRVTLDFNLLKSEKNSYHIRNTGNLSNSYFITTNTKGQVVKIGLNGKHTIETVLDVSEDHYFDYKDVNADGVSDYIFLDDKTLWVYDITGNKIFKQTFKNKVTQSPVYYHFSYNDRKIGVVTDNDLIYLLNKNGQVYKGFPVEGRTQFTIGYFDLTISRFNLIVGGRNNFLYNYAVE